MSKKSNNKNPTSSELNKKEKPNAYVKLFPLLLFLFTFLLYGQTIFFDWGLDDNYILESIYKIDNTWVGIVSVFKQALGSDYRPITILSFWIEKQIFNGLKPNSAHFINVLLFGLLNIQIFRFIILGNFYENKNKLLAFALLVSFIFIVHPTHISVVANVKSRDNLLSMLIGITSAIQFFRFLEDRKKFRFLLIPILLTFAMLSKMDAYVFIVFPFLYMLFYKKLNWKPLLISAIFISVFFNFFFVLKDTLLDTLVSQEVSNRVFIDSPLIGYDSFTNRVSLGITSLLYYFKFFAIPFGHYAYFGFNQIPLNNLLNPLNLFSISILMGLMLFAFLHFKRDRIYLFGLLFFLCSIFYALNLVAIVSGVVMDRYNFIGSLGLSIFLAAFLISYLKITDYKQLKNIFVILLLALLTIFTLIRLPNWKDTRTLLLKDIKHLNNSAHAHVMVSSLFINPVIFGNLSEAEKDSNMKEGIKHLNRALEITDINPFVHESKGIAEIYYENYETSLFHLKTAHELDSNNLSSLNYVGVVFRNQNKLDSAAHYFEYVMNKENRFYYAANNYIETLLYLKALNKIDSSLQVLQARFPDDKSLQKKTLKWKATSRWED